MIFKSAWVRFVQFKNDFVFASFNHQCSALGIFSLDLLIDVPLVVLDAKLKPTLLAHVVMIIGEGLAVI